MIKSTEVELAEDAPANVSGGTGINSPNPDMANIDKPMSLVKRERFADKEVFEVDDQFYQRCIHGKAKYAKYADYVGNDETGEAIRQYGRSNPKASILVKNKNTQNMTYLRRINEETGEEMELNHRIDESMFGPGDIIPTAQLSSVYVVVDTKGKYKTILLDADPQRHFEVPEDFLKDMEKNLKIKKVSIQQFDDKVGLGPHDDMVRAFFTKNANISESVIETATMAAWLAATGIVFAHGYYEMTRETYQKLRVMIDNRRQIAKQSGSGILTDYSKQINKITDNLEKIFNKAKITK